MTIKELIDLPTLTMTDGIEIKFEMDGYSLGIAGIDYDEQCALIFEYYNNRGYHYYMSFDETI